MTTDFMNAARALRTSHDKRMDFCQKIANHKDFAAVAAYDPDGARYVVDTAFQSLTGEGDLWNCVMAFIQADAASAMANSIRPEYLVNVLQGALKKMPAQDRADILDFLPMTTAGAALKKNYPASSLMLRLG
jgi:hypothetical protein